MNVIQPDQSVWKVALALMLVVLLTGCFGALGLSGTGLLNWEKQAAEADALRQEANNAARREAIRIDAQAPVEHAQAAADIRGIAAQADYNEAMLQEALAQTKATNARAADLRERFGLAGLLLALLAGCGLVVVLVYGALLLVRRAVDRVAPERPIGLGQAAAAQAAAPIRPTASPHRPPARRPAAPPVRPADLWDDPVYRAEKRRQARARELEAIRRRRRQPPTVIILPPTPGRGRPERSRAV